MKPSFIHKLINNPFDDPCLYIRIIREKRALLFDIGDISNLSQGELYKITDVFVTHTHIDHFIGFDYLLRAILKRNTPLRVYGPSNIVDCIEGKLKGYTWNHIKEYPIKIYVNAVTDNLIHSYAFEAENAFHKKQITTSEFKGLLLEEPMFKIKAIQINHQIPCLGFKIEENFHININKAILTERGFTVGPWLTELKKAIRLNKDRKTEIIINNNKYTIEDLIDIASISRGQKISYILDVAPEEENILKIIDFVRESDVLYCEAYFMKKDKEQAIKRFHLTSDITGRIASEAGVKELVPIHFSPRYMKLEENPHDEAISYFKNRAS